MSIELFAALLFVASLVALTCKRLRLPYTVGLTLTGIAIAFVPGIPQFTLTKELIFSVLLPPLIFEAAMQIRLDELKRDAVLLAVLATVGVLLSTAVVASGMAWILGWGWVPAILMAVLISATDPVAVIATFREQNLKGRLKLLVEAESLLNDGTAAVLFGLTLAAMSGASFTVGGAVLGFFVTVFGGIAVGAAVSALVILLTGRTKDHLVEVTFSCLCAFGSFLLAEKLHVSGVLATLTAGIVIRNVGHSGQLSDQGREAVNVFWDFAAFFANSLIFLLIGFRLAVRSYTELLGSLAILILFTLIARAIAVYGCCGLFTKSSFKVPVKFQHILFWGGLRGALALALALSIPAETPLRETIIDLTFGAVCFSVVVHGLTIGKLLERLGLGVKEISSTEMKVIDV